MKLLALCLWLNPQNYFWKVITETSCVEQIYSLEEQLFINSPTLLLSWPLLNKVIAEKDST